MSVPALSHFWDHEVHHPYLEVLPEAEFRWGWAEEKNLVLYLQGERPFVIALGEDQEAVEQLLEKSREVAPHCRLAIQRKFRTILDNQQPHDERSEWDWMAIFDGDALIPPVIEVLDLGIDRDEQIKEFLSIASPTASTQPGSPEVITWHGVVHEGDLLAVGAAIRWSSGAAVLASIATAPEARGQGLATQVTASLTRALFYAGEKRVSLGLYANNPPARRAYEKVGFRLLEEFISTSR